MWFPMGFLRTNRLCGASLMFVLMCCTAAHSADNKHAEEHQDRYREIFLRPIAENEYQPQPDETCNCQQAGHSRELSGSTRSFQRRPIDHEPWAYISAFGGGTYSDTAGRDGPGAQYGLFGVKPLTSALALFGSASLRHYEDGTQFGGTVGLFRSALPGRHLSDRIGWAVNYDQFTDTGLGSPYIGALRYDVHFHQSGLFVPGVRYSHSITGGKVDSVVPGGGGVPLTSFDLVEAYVKSSIGSADVLVGAGYLSDSDDMNWRFDLNQPLGDDLAALLQAGYSESGDWNGFFGLTYELNGPTQARRRVVPGTVVRGQSPQGVPVDTLGSLRRTLQGSARDATLDRIDFMIAQFGANQIIPRNAASEIIALARQEATPSEVQSSNSNSLNDSSALSGSAAELRDLELSLTQDPKRLVREARQQLSDALFQQNRLQNFVRRRSVVSGGGGNTDACPPTFPFRVISGGNCFCCTNAGGTGLCVNCGDPGTL